MTVCRRRLGACRKGKVRRATGAEFHAREKLSRAVVHVLDGQHGARDRKQPMEPGHIAKRQRRSLEGRPTSGK